MQITVEPLLLIELSSNTILHIALSCIPVVVVAAYIFEGSGCILVGYYLIEEGK